MNEIFKDKETLEFINAMLIIFAFSAVCNLVLALIKMFYAKSSGIKKWGFCLLPIGTDYITGKLADKYNDKKLSILLPALSGVSLITAVGYIVSEILMRQIEFESPAYALLFSAGFLLEVISHGFGVATFVLNIVAFYRIFAYKNKDSAKIWTVMTVLLCGIPKYIFMLAFSKKPGTPKTEEAQTKASDYKTEGDK